MNIDNEYSIRLDSMKIGKVPENVLKRSVIKQIHKRRDEVLLGSAVGEDCTAFRIPPEELVVMSVDPITGATKDVGKLAVNITANDIASAGAEIIGIMLSILLPENTSEEELRSMVQDIDNECEKLGIEVMGGHTEVTAAVNIPVITVTGVGKVKETQLVSTGGAKPGDDIVVTKWIGLEGTSIIAKEKEPELSKRFAPAFIETAKRFDEYLSVTSEAAVAVNAGVKAMHDVTEGGIFGALWEMAEASGVGLEIDLKKIPVKQETIEISNFYDINPYQLISSGAMLMASEDGERLVRELEKNGIHAAVIGIATEGNDRIIKNSDETRYLEPPKADELYRVI